MQNGTPAEAQQCHRQSQMRRASVVLECDMTVDPSPNTEPPQRPDRTVLPVAFYPWTLAEKFYREGEAAGEVRSEARGKLKGRLMTLQELTGLPVSTDQELALLSVAEFEQKAKDVQGTAEFQQFQQAFRERHQTASLKDMTE